MVYGVLKWFMISLPLVASLAILSLDLLYIYIQVQNVHILKKVFISHLRLSLQEKKRKH